MDGTIYKRTPAADIVPPPFLLVSWRIRTDPHLVAFHAKHDDFNLFIGGVGVILHGAARGIFR